MNKKEQNLTVTKKRDFNRGEVSPNASMNMKSEVKKIEAAEETGSGEVPWNPNMEPDEPEPEEPEEEEPEAELNEEDQGDAVNTHQILCLFRSKEARTFHYSFTGRCH